MNTGIYQVVYVGNGSYPSYWGLDFDAVTPFDKWSALKSSNFQDGKKIIFSDVMVGNAFLLVFVYTTNVDGLPTSAMVFFEKVGVTKTNIVSSYYPSSIGVAGTYIVTVDFSVVSSGYLVFGGLVGLSFNGGYMKLVQKSADKM